MAKCAPVAIKTARGMHHVAPWRRQASGDERRRRGGKKTGVGRAGGVMSRGPHWGAHPLLESRGRRRDSPRQGTHPYHISSSSGYSPQTGEYSPKYGCWYGGRKVVKRAFDSFPGAVTRHNFRFPTRPKRFSPKTATVREAVTLFIANLITFLVLSNLSPRLRT